MIEVKNLVKKYGNHLAVDHLDFQIKPGMVYGFLGPNGAGKSTTMNIMTGCMALMYKDKNGKGYSQTYLKTINCQLTAIFNYAIRYYNLQDNPCRKAGVIGKSKGEPKDFWMQEEFNDFLETVSDKPETRMAFLLLYWSGMRIGELLALTYDDINLEEKTISITKSYQRLKGKDVITQPKTPKSIRIITMPDFLADEFREYCSHLYGIMKNERLFHFTKSHMEHGGVLPWAAMPLTAGNDRKKAAALISQNRHQ